MIVRLYARHAKIYFEHVLLERGPEVGKPLEVKDSSGKSIIMTLVPTRVRYAHPDDDPEDPSTWTKPGFTFRTHEHREGGEFWRVEFK